MAPRVTPGTPAWFPSPSFRPIGREVNRVGDTPGVSAALDVRRLAPADAPGLGALIRRCYGERYPKRVMYRPQDLAALIGSGGYDGVVAAVGADVVGHIGFSRPAPEATVVEAGTTLVDPARRGEGIMGRLGAALGELLVAEGVCGFVHFPTTAHAVMQRASVSAGGRETGVLLGYLPEAAPGEGRLAVTVVHQPVLPAPSGAWCPPDRYAGLLRETAAALGLEREVAVRGGGPVAVSELACTADPARGLERVTVGRIGADLAARVAQETSAGLVHVDLPLDDPAIDGAVEALRRASFAYGAWLPGWAGHDVLRLQRIAAPTPAELAPALESAQARRIIDLIREELRG